MLNKDKDRTPAKALKRAAADLRCAARKMGIDAARAELRLLAAEEKAKGGGSR